MTLKGIWLALALLGGAGAAIMQVSYASQELERRLAELNEQIRSERSRLHVLQAEWAYLNRPQRLRRLAERYLVLEPTETTRIVAADAVPVAAGVGGAGARLPAPMPAVGGPAAPLPRPAVPRPALPAPDAQPERNAPAGALVDRQPQPPQSGQDLDGLIRATVAPDGQVAEAP